MNRRRIAFVLLSFISTLITGLAWSVHAQSPLIATDDILIYLRARGQQGQYVRLSSTFQQVYNLPMDKCSLRSLDATYVAESPLPNKSGDLIVRRLDTQAIIIQTPWRAEWDACYINWSTDTVLTIRQHGTQQDFFYFDVSSGTLTPVSNPYVPPQYPSLPGWIPSIPTNFILPSPQAQVYLYERCTGLQTDPSGHVCASKSDFVIYDAIQQDVLHVLQQPNGDRIRGYVGTYPPPDRDPGSYPAAAWSASGRYLAFQRYAVNPYDYFTLSVYDVTSGQYENIDWMNPELDKNRALEWSPQGNKLAFWTIGRFGEYQNNDNYDTLRTPVIFDAETGQFTICDQPFDIDAEHAGKAFTWSPDGQTLVFVDANKNLIDMNVSSGITTILDSQVDSVILWKHGA